LGQEDLAGHHDMLCDSTQHDHRGWERVKPPLLLWQCWHPCATRKEPQSRRSFSWSTPCDWECKHSLSTPGWSCRAPLAVGWAAPRLMMCLCFTLLCPICFEQFFYFSKNIVVIFGMIILCLRVLFDVVIITRMIIVWCLWWYLWYETVMRVWGLSQIFEP
jgi:hypothetical protein